MASTNSAARAQILFNQALALQKAGNDTKQTIVLYRQAALLGHPGAMHNLAGLYLAQEKIALAIEVYREAVHLKYLPSMNDLACLLMELNSTEEENETYYYDEAWQLLHEGSSLGHADAMNNLASLYLDRDDIEGNVDRAIKLYRTASDLGHADAMYNLAGLYRKNNDIPNNVDRAIELYRMAAIRGHANAMNELASLLFRDTFANKGYEESYDTAFKKYHNSDKSNIANTLHTLASLLNKLPGKELQKRMNYVNAFALWEDASDLGHADATYNLVALWRQRKPIKNQDKAYNLMKIVELYEKASMQGHVEAKLELPDAMNELANLLLILPGTKEEKIKNHNTALTLYKKASSLGHIEAKENLKNVENLVSQQVKQSAKGLTIPPEHPKKAPEEKVLNVSNKHSASISPRLS